MDRKISRFRNSAPLHRLATVATRPNHMNETNSDTNRHPDDELGSVRSRWLTALRRLAPAERDTLEPEAAAETMRWAAETGVSEEHQLQAMAEVLGTDFRQDLGSLEGSDDYMRCFEITFARRHGVMGFRGPDETLQVAVCKWSGWSALNNISRVVGKPVEPLLAGEHAVESAINSAYERRSGKAQEVVDTFDKEELLRQIQGLEGREDLLDSTGRAPVIRLVNSILSDAVKAGASDIHVQPYEDRVVVRQRIDGVLFDYIELPKGVQEEVLSRIKVLGRMDIAEKRLPQDGRTTVQLGDRVVDLRIASLPTSHNERIVIRLLDKSAKLYSLAEVGMRNETFGSFCELINLDHGLILVTGPTGSGKSTTLYAAIQEINTTDQNVLTLEDPIEYQLDGISQTQINEKKGMTFASGLRSVLRQDPDIIMVGEIRDHETAVMAIQASLTGHLVFSTLHTNDAASALTRLLDLGIEPYLVSSSLVASLAQRLVRRICQECKTVDVSASVEPAMYDRYPGFAGRSLYAGEGCANCRGTGYRGRVGVFELLVMDDRCRQIVQSRGNAAEIRSAAVEGSMSLLKDDGINKVFDGQTTIEEVHRVLGT
jgi:general secretion pathway protein E